MFKVLLGVVWWFLGVVLCSGLDSKCIVFIGLTICNSLAKSAFCRQLPLLRKYKIMNRNYVIKARFI